MLEVVHALGPFGLDTCNGQLLEIPQLLNNAEGSAWGAQDNERNEG